MRLIRFCYCQKGITVMFDDFDYKKALGGGGKLVKGVVKVVSPQAGPGIDEAGGGLNYYFFGHNLKLQVDYFRNFAPGLVREGGDLFRLQIQAAL